MRDVRTREGEPGWFASLLGAGVLIAGGFALGLVAGVVSEEPELVVGHLVGRSEEVAWLPDAEPELTPSGERVELLQAEVVARAEPAAGLERVEDADGIAMRERSLPPVAAAAPSLAEVSRSRGPTAPPAVESALPTRRSRREPREIDSLPQVGSPASMGRSREGFAVQVGAFAEGGAAEDVRQRLRSKGFDSYVIPASQSGDGKWRVRVGPVSTKGAAERLASRLKTEERLPTWVLTEEGG